MQYEPHLIGRRLGTRGAVRGEMGLPSLDVVLGLTAGRIDLLVEMLAAPSVEIGHDVAGVPPPGADLYPGHYAAGF